MTSEQGQLFDLQEGVARKEAGVKQVEETDARGLRWIDRARVEAIRIAVASPNNVATSDDVRLWTERTQDRPHHPNAWGAIFKKKEWSIVGYVRATFVTNHGRRIGVWKLAE